MSRFAFEAKVIIPQLPKSRRVKVEGWVDAISSSYANNMVIEKLQSLYPGFGSIQVSGLRPSDDMMLIIK